jgi:hypothetical protein
MKYHYFPNVLAQIASFLSLIFRQWPELIDYRINFKHSDSEKKRVKKIYKYTRMVDKALAAESMNKKCFKNMPFDEQIEYLEQKLSPKITHMLLNKI